MRLSLFVAALMMVLVATAWAGRETAHHVLGIRPGMSEHDAQRRLTKLGGDRKELEKPEGEEEGEEKEGMEFEMWTLRDPRFERILLGIDHEKRVRWIHAYVRAGGRRMAYRDVGDLQRARRTGDTIWVWEVPAKGKHPAFRVEARGQDSTWLASLSLVQSENDPNATR
jgi:hypothetical protein